MASINLQILLYIDRFTTFQLQAITLGTQYFLRESHEFAVLMILFPIRDSFEKEKYQLAGRNGVTLVFSILLKYSTLDVISVR